MTKNKKLEKWVTEMFEMCNPDKIVWIDGSEEQKNALRKEAQLSGELLELNQEKWPGCVYHRTAENDVARTEDLTFICTSQEVDAGPNNNWMSPEEGYKKAGEIFKGSMKGRTMYVIPFSMGPVGSPFSKIGIELSDSIYVVLNMGLMTRIGQEVLDALGEEGEFTMCLHGKADLDPERRLILHFPENNAIWSVGSGYGGNVLLGKKCLSLRIASYLAKNEGWLAEHMLIMGIEDPSGNIEYIAAAFPSACGKTNLAMLIPPESLQKKGYRVWTIGDDIAWLRIGGDGRLWAVNPESGFFGVVPGTNAKSNLNVIKTIRNNTIFTNVLLTDDGDIWWEDGEGDPPPEGTAWNGMRWKPGMKDEKGNYVFGAHPNSRFTAPANQCPIISPEWEDPKGVPISAIVFGGRRSKVAPLVYESFNWQHGVFVGATMASERTAAQYGAQGEVRRDPMAMLPFCGYNMGDYFTHWLAMGKTIKNPPKIFHVNWFQTDENGKFIWPGFGENLRVLEWIVDRTKGKADATETSIGYIPLAGDLHLDGLDITENVMKNLLNIDVAEWQKELVGIKEFFATFGDRLPGELVEEYNALEDKLKNK